MDWIKIKSEHISPEYSDAQVGALVRFQLLVARLKRMPTDKEIMREVSKKNWTSLIVGMKLFGVDPKLVCSKVLEDVDLIERRTKSGRDASQRYRHKNRLKIDNKEVLSDDDGDDDGDMIVMTQIREDKKRKKKNEQKEIITDRQKLSSSSLEKFLRKPEVRQDAVGVFIEHQDEAKQVAKLYTQLQQKTPGSVIQAQIKRTGPNAPETKNTIEKYERRVFRGLIGEIDWDVMPTIDDVLNGLRIENMMALSEKNKQDNDAKINSDAEKFREMLKNGKEKIETLDPETRSRLADFAVERVRESVPGLPDISASSSLVVREMCSFVMSDDFENFMQEKKNGTR